jgi:hypothetical protein
MKKEQRNLTSLKTLEDFIARLHEKEVQDGEIRGILYDIIYDIDNNIENNESPIIYKIVLANNITSHRTSKSTAPSDCIVHCRCGSVYDENSLVQCYACQVRFLMSRRCLLKFVNVYYLQENILHCSISYFHL